MQFKLLERCKNMVWIKEDEGYADLPNVIKCMSINPEVMNAVIEMGHKLSLIHI